MLRTCNERVWFLSAITYANVHPDNEPYSGLLKQSETVKPNLPPPL